MSEAEKRLHRCCFSGHRPEKLDQDEGEVTAWLDTQISQAIDEGCTTFITGMGMGVEIWAGELVIRRRAENPSLHLIAAVPWPGFAARWSDEWKQRYAALLAQADLTVNVCERYVQDVFRKRNEWMLDHSVRLIAYYNGEDGGTAQAVHAAESRQVQVICGGMRQAPADYVAYDLETTGLSPLANRILQIGAVRVIGGVETETFQALVNPGVEIDPYITQLTGIAQSDVADAPDISEVLPRFRAFVGDLPLVGFNNINFDSRFLKAAGMRHRSDEFDVMLYAGRFRAQLGFEKGRPGLAKLSERLQIVNPRAHRALADALTTARCLEALRHLADEAKP